MKQKTRSLPNFGDEVYVQAAKWIELLSEGQLDKAARRGLQHWLNAHPGHRLLLERMTVSWADPALLVTLSEFSECTLLQRLIISTSNAVKSTLARASLLAVILATVIAAIGYYSA